MRGERMTTKRRIALERLGDMTRGATAGHLAIGTELSAQSMSRMLGHLADARLAACTVHPDGRRIATVWHITDAGRRALEEADHG